MPSAETKVVTAVVQANKDAHIIMSLNTGRIVVVRFNVLYRGRKLTGRHFLAENQNTNINTNVESTAEPILDPTLSAQLLTANLNIVDSTLTASHRRRSFYTDMDPRTNIIEDKKDENNMKMDEDGVLDVQDQDQDQSSTVSTVPSKVRVEELGGVTAIDVMTLRGRLNMLVLGDTNGFLSFISHNMTLASKHAIGQKNEKIELVVAQSNNLILSGIKESVVLFNFWKREIITSCRGPLSSIVTSIAREFFFLIVEFFIYFTDNYDKQLTTFFFFFSLFVLFFSFSFSLSSSVFKYTTYKKLYR